MAVHRSRERDAGDGAAPPPTAPGCSAAASPQPAGGVYHTRSPSLEAQREHAAALLRVGVGAVAVGQHDAADVRERHVDVRADRSPSPTARRPSCRPCRRASARALRRPRRDRARARCRTSGRPRAARRPFGEGHQDRRRAEVEVGAVRVGAVGLVGQAARRRVGVLVGHLPVPQDLARVRGPARRTRRSSATPGRCSCCRS